MTSNKLNQDIGSLELALDTMHDYRKNPFLSNKFRANLEDCCSHLETIIGDFNDFIETLED